MPGIGVVLTTCHVINLRMYEHPETGSHVCKTKSCLVNVTDTVGCLFNMKFPFLLP